MAGLEQQRLDLESKIATVRNLLGLRKAKAEAAAAAPKRKRRLSAAARRRISEAQKHRWALAKAKATKKTARSAV